jgi:hypothetical protein
MRRENICLQRGRVASEAQDTEYPHLVLRVPVVRLPVRLVASPPLKLYTIVFVSTHATLKKQHIRLVT